MTANRKEFEALTSEWRVGMTSLHGRYDAVYEKQERIFLKFSES